MTDYEKYIYFIRFEKEETGYYIPAENPTEAIETAEGITDRGQEDINLIERINI